MTAPAATRRLYRRPGRVRVGGVALGIAEHLRVQAAVVRAAFVALALVGGFGIALYSVYWIVLPAAPDSLARGRVAVWMENLLGAVTAVAAVVAVAFGVPMGGLVAPILLGGIGGALLWRQATETDRERWRRLSRTSLSARGTDRIGRIRVVAGAALVVGGGALVLARADVSAIRDGLIAVTVTVVGIALITGPWWMRTVTQLRIERTERIRAQERTEIAARLHDSVLQTLALIQRNADSPREVTRLARGQERALRSLLYASPEAAGQLPGALRDVAADVEDAYAVTVEVIVVGDVALDGDLVAAVQAAREALINSARHGQVTSMALYAEVETDAVSVYVRDRGIGFDVDAVADDRQGVRGSIIGRVARHGGTATIRSQLGGGTEVAITMPRARQ
jgi:signal transduction histidine kinase